MRVSSSIEQGVQGLLGRRAREWFEGMDSGQVMESLGSCAERSQLTDEQWKGFEQGRAT